MYNSKQNQNIVTDSTHANSNSESAPNIASKRLRSQQNYIGSMNTQTALNAIVTN
jgi:hypothetical protein